MTKQKTNKNIALIVLGPLLFLFGIGVGKNNLIAGRILAAIGFFMTLRGFGMAWTRKEAKAIKSASIDNHPSAVVGSAELIKAWRGVIDGDEVHGWRPMAAAIVHISGIPNNAIDTAEVTTWSRKYNFPKYAKGYDGVLWIAREDTPCEPGYMLIFSPVFNNITDIKLWNKVPLMLCPDIESWLEIKEASEKTLIIDDNIKMTPLTNDKDFSILTALLKTKRYKDIK